MLPSFFMAGFECATGCNRNGEVFDQVAATEHDVNMLADYERAVATGMRVAREGVRWPVVDQGSVLDFTSLDVVLEAAAATGVVPIYDLFHYGYPCDLDVFSTEFVTRFRRYCGAVACHIAAFGQPPYFFTPINEPSYFSWAGGEAGLFAPHCEGRGWDLKVQLARAAIAGIDAIRAILPEARIVNVDPVCRVVPPLDQPELAAEAQAFNEKSVFESWDMLAGRLLPELGGSARHLDIVGVNYYWTNQWEHTILGVPLEEDDPRIWPLRDLLRWVWHRYRHPMILTETAHVDKKRANWIRTMTAEVENVLDEGIPLRGACLYPVLGMPEWHERDVWTRMGLWDLQPSANGLRRVPHRPSLGALAEAQARLEGLQLPRAYVSH